MNSAAVAAIEVYFKDYLIVCEYLKLDPTQDYNEGIVRLRAEELLSHHSFLEQKPKKKLERKINWFLRNYKKLTGKWFGFPKRCTKLIKKDMLFLHEGTIQDDFSSFDLTQQNYDYFSQKELKYVVIALLIIFGFVLLAGTATAMILLL